jgi:hypothetical protein
MGEGGVGVTATLARWRSPFARHPGSPVPRYSGTAIRDSPAVYLDDQPCLMTDKISDIAPQRHLATKSMTFYLARAQHLPDLVLGFGHLAAQCLRLLTGSIAWVFLHSISIIACDITPTLASPIEGEGNQTSRMRGNTFSAKSSSDCMSRPVSGAPGFWKARSRTPTPTSSRHRLICSTTVSGLP